MTLTFKKYEGLGNDFIVVDESSSEREFDRDLARRLCDRHRGVGADGVLQAGVGPDGPFMRVTNADGSRPEMCGNGLRCVAVHLVQTGLVTDDEFDVMTDAGPHRCVVSDGLVEVTMVVPSLVPAAVPVDSHSKVINQEWVFGNKALHVTAVSMGNPHVITFDDVGDERLVLGPRMEKDVRFPQGVNVSFCEVLHDSEIETHVWERGVGWTLACGTGACAVAVAAVETGRARRHKPVRVKLPGGELSIVVPEPDEPVRMTGPASYVFDGTFPD